MTDTTDPCVDALTGWQQLFCREVRQLVRIDPSFFQRHGCHKPGFADSGALVR